MRIKRGRELARNMGCPVGQQEFLAVENFLPEVSGRMTGNTEVCRYNKPIGDKSVEIRVGRCKSEIDVRQKQDGPGM